MGDQLSVSASMSGKPVIGGGFDAEADLDLVHQDLDSAAEFFDHFGGGSGPG